MRPARKEKKPSEKIPEEIPEKIAQRIPEPLWEKLTKIDFSALFRLLIVIIILIVILSFFIDLKFIFFLLIVLFVNSRMERFQLRKGIPSRFELTTFTTVLVAVNYGLLLGILTGVFSRLFISFYTKNIAIDHFFLILSYVLTAAMAYFIPLPIVPLGLLITMINNVFMFILGKFMLGFDITINSVLCFSNILINFLLFVSPLGELILLWLSSTA